MSGSVCIVAQETARYTLFSVALMQLQHPAGTKIDWNLSNDTASARNTLCRRALDTGSEWVLFIDDDHVYPPDLLNRLLAHDKPIVSALYLRRGQPFGPVAFASRDDETQTYTSIDLTALPREGLLKVHACGAGGLLIRREVLEQIPEPWFQYGVVGKWNASEDVIFCEKANEAGFDIFVDLATHLGHMAPSAVWPSWVDNEWAVGFSVADGLRLYCPIEKAADAPAPADAVRR